MTAQPFVAARHNAILVPGFYVEKKKVNSSTPEQSNSGQNSVSSSRYATEQPHDVTVSNNDGSNNDGIEADEIVSLKRNEGGGIMREDTADQNRVNAEIIGELNTPKETEIEEVACDEELSLAKEFGAAKLLGSGRKANKNPTPRDSSNSSVIFQVELHHLSCHVIWMEIGFTNKKPHVQHVPGHPKKELVQRITW